MRTILIIDDDPVILELLTVYLTAEGFRVSTASDGHRGLAAFDAERPDTVLCDLSMPGLGGLGVLTEVKHRAPQVPFVVFSGTGDVGMAVEALRQGAWDYLLKPLPDLNLLPPLLARLEERAVFLREKELYQTRLEQQVKDRTAELVHQLREKDIILAEVHHRVKNNLQIIQVILALQHDHSADPQVRAALEAGQNRIHALAMVQDEMHDTDHAAGVGARNYGLGIIHHLLSAHGLTTGVDLTMTIDDVALAPGLAFTIGLILNELMAGLAQGRPRTGHWKLNFRLSSANPQEAELSLTESTGAWAEWVSSEDRVSLGWDLVAALAAQHGGGVTWDPGAPGTMGVRLR